MRFRRSPLSLLLIVATTALVAAAVWQRSSIDPFVLPDRVRVTEPVLDLSGTLLPENIIEQPSDGSVRFGWSQIASLTDVQPENVAVLLVGSGSASQLKLTPAATEPRRAAWRPVTLTLAVVAGVTLLAGMGFWLRSFRRGRP